MEKEGTNEKAADILEEILGIRSRKRKREREEAIRL